MALGRAYTAMADDVSSIFTNPAGLSYIKGFGFTSMKANLMTDIGYTMLGVANRFSFGEIGFGWVNSSLPTIPLTRFSSTGIVETYGYTDYSFNAFVLSYSNSLGGIFKKGALKDVSVGASLKYFRQGFSANTGAMEGSQGTGFNMDAGAIYKPNNWINLGLSASNLLPAGMGGKFDWQKDHTQEDIPAVYKIGTAIKVIGADGLRRLGSSEVTFSFDTEFRQTQVQTPALMHGGAEWKIAKPLCIRLGFDQQPASNASLARVETNYSCGVGFKLQDYTFDYAYHQFGELAENATHYISISYAMNDMPSVKRPEIEQPKSEPSAHGTSTSTDDLGGKINKSNTDEDE